MSFEDNQQDDNYQLDMACDEIRNLQSKLDAATKRAEEAEAARNEAREIATFYKNSVAKFLNAKGQDLCHENRRELALACGLFDHDTKAPANVQEFDD